MSKYTVICNSESKSIFTDKNYFIADNPELLKKVYAEHARYYTIIIEIELNWDENNLERTADESYGIEIAKKLRVEYKIKTPIIFFSFTPLSQHLEKGKNEILIAPGHNYIQMPTEFLQLDTAIKGTNPLTDMQLADVSRNMCSIYGVIDEILHNMKGKKTSEIFPHFRKLRSIFSFSPEAIKIISGLENKIQSIKDESNIHLINSYGAILLSLVSEKESDEIDTGEERKWGALILDDEIDYCENFKALLSKKGLTKIYTAINVAQAEEIINKDKKNEITVIIADYRLYENVFGTKKYQKKQGYDFLFDIAQKERINALFALSGLTKSFLLQSFRKYNTRVAVFSKNDIAEVSGARIFIDEIFAAGEDAYNSVLSMPKAEEWKNIKPFYIHYRNIMSDEIERRINTTSRQIIGYAKQLISSNDPEMFLVSENKLIKENTLTAKLDNKNPAIEKDFEVFINKMIARRVILWLYFFEGMDSKAIVALLKTGNINPVNIKEADVKSVKSTNAVTFEDFPASILIEEKNWFKYDMGVDINDLSEIISQISCYFEIKLNEYFGKNKLDKKIFGDLLVNGKLVLNSRQDVKKVIILALKYFNTTEEKRSILTFIKNNILKIIMEDTYCAQYLGDLNGYLNSCYNEELKRSTKYQN